MILSVRRPFPLFVAGLALLQAGLSLDGFTSGAESAAQVQEMSDLARSVKGIASLLLIVPIGMLIDVLRPRTALLAMSLLAVATAGFNWFGLSLWFDFRPYALVVGLVSAMLLVAAPVAQEAYVPAVAGRDRLLRANALVTAASALAYLATDLLFDRPFAFLRWVSLPLTVVPLAVAAVSFWMMRTPAAPRPPRTSFAEVMGFARTHPVIRAIGAYLLLTALSEPLASEYVAGAAGLRAGSFTFDLLDQGAAVAGAALAVLLGRRLGMIRLAWAAVVATQPFALLLLLADDTPWGIACHWLALYVPLLGWTVTAIALLGLRQEVVPDGMLGRVTVLLALLVIPAMIVGRSLAFLSGPVALSLGVAGLLAAALPLRKAERVARPETETPVAG